VSISRSGKSRPKAENCRKILRSYGYEGFSVEECIKDWCKKQYTTAGLVKYYEAYYNEKHDNT